MHHDRLDTVRKVYAALADGDLETLSGYMHPDVECVFSDEVPLGGVWRGRERTIALLRDYLAQFESLHLDIDEWLVSDGAVVVIGNSHGRTLGGGNLWQPFVHVLRLQEGQVVRFTKYADATKELRALGLMPAAP